MLRLNNIIKSVQSILVFVICLGFSFPQAYNISGKVLDSQTNKPLNNVNIFIDKYNIGTITDNQGYFSLFISDNSINKIELHIKIIGYEEKILLLNLANNKIDIGEVFLISE